jgi:hypothetical protein
MIGGSSAIGEVLRTDLHGVCRLQALWECLGAVLLVALAHYDLKIHLISLRDPFLLSLVCETSPYWHPHRQRRTDAVVTHCKTAKSSLPPRTERSTIIAQRQYLVQHCNTTMTLLITASMESSYRFFSSFHCLRFPSDTFTFLRRLPFPLTSCSIKIPFSFCFLRFRALCAPRRFMISSSAIRDDSYSDLKVRTSS